MLVQEPHFENHLSTRTVLACISPLGENTVYTLSSSCVSSWDIFAWSHSHVPTHLPIKLNYM